MGSSISVMLKAARACLNTPFHHQGRTPHLGLDCIGLVIVALKATGMKIKDRTDYAVKPDGISLIGALEEHGATKVECIEAGDVLVFRYDQQPQHVAIATSQTSLIHAFAPARRVVETSIGAYWRHRLVAIYRFNQISKKED